jgi:apolipoprotein N-acyltransferase
VGICYDSAFGQHFRQQAKQGEFIITASNNAHYAASMPAQHHAQDVMRSIETSRWAVRATNTGYSAIVDPHGHTLWKSQLNEFATHSHQIDRRRNQTFYVQWGDWLTPLLGIISLLLLWIYRDRAAGQTNL